MEELTAAGGVILRNEAGNKDPEVLLIFRRGVWDLPKGKREPNETIEECAVREVAEEIGVAELPEIIAPLVKTWHDYEQDGVLIGKTTYWYAMRLISEEVSFIPEEKEDIQKVEWHPLQSAKEKLGYENLVDVLGALE